MKKLRGKIMLVDDEHFELELLEIALKAKDWDVKVEYYNNPETALENLRSNDDEIFLIISDMHMPRITGLEFKKIIDQDEVLKKKSIPFIFSTSSASHEQVTEAYEYRVQGYFKKTNSVDEQAEMLDTIIKYWIDSIHPNMESHY